MINLYEILGVAKDASHDEIAKAYRNLARKYHPDNSKGGDKEAFNAVAHAWEILGDADKRARYDETGQINGASNIIEASVVQAVNSVLVSCDQDHPNPIRVMCDQIDQQRASHRSDKAKHERQLKKVKERLERFTKANEQTTNTAARDLIAGTLAHAIEQLEKAIAADQEQIELGDTILAYLNDIKWDESPRRSPFGADYILNQVVPSRRSFLAST